MQRLAISAACLAFALSVTASTATGQVYEIGLFKNNLTKTSSSPLSGYQDDFQGGGGYRWGTATCKAGALYTTGYNQHGSGTYVAAAGGDSEFTVSDLVFSSPTSAPISVGLNLSLSGSFSYDVSPSNYFVASMIVDVGSNGQIGNFTVDGTGVVSSGLLSGYDGVGPLDISAGPFSVPVNTPLSMRVFLRGRSMTSSGWNLSRHQQALAFGGTTGDGGLFDLPPGVTVDSVEAGIVGNTWIPSTELYLSAMPEMPGPGQTFQMTAFNGDFGQPVGLILTSVGGTPKFVYTGLSGAFDADGHYLAPTITTAPAWAGLDFGLTAITLSAGLELKISDEVLITVQ